MSAILVQTTTESVEEAERLAQLLIERRLAACVQIVGPIQSVYRWQEQIAREQEFLLQIKTIESQFDAVAECLREHHPYDVPEVIGIKIDSVLPDYLTWLQKEVNQE